jgi:type VI secretion system protein ImpC
VHESETGPDLQIEVLNVSKDDLLEDVSEAPDLDQSALWKKVYEEEYGTYGGEPFGVLMGDYQFQRSSQDLFLLRKIANVAAAAHAPFLTAASPQLFFPEPKYRGKKDAPTKFTDLPGVRDLASLFDDKLGATTEWNAFRESEDSRYVSLCLPHILLRLPYGKDTVPVKRFRFEEMVDGPDHDKYLWGNAAYALTTRITASFARHHWCSAIRGPQGGGLVEDLPVHSFPTELAITERFDNQLSQLGFLPLVYRKKSNQAAFFGGQSAQKAKYYGARNTRENASARLSAQLPYILSTSRFAHYIKVMMRDSIGTAASRKQIEDYLDNWIRTYTCDPSCDMATKAQYPLSEATVEVAEVEGKPGVYKAVAYLKPHFLLDQIDVALSLVAELPNRLGG